MKVRSGWSRSKGGRLYQPAILLGVVGLAADVFIAVIPPREPDPVKSRETHQSGPIRSRSYAERVRS